MVLPPRYSAALSLTVKSGSTERKEPWTFLKPVELKNLISRQSWSKHPVKLFYASCLFTELGFDRAAIDERLSQIESRVTNIRLTPSRHLWITLENGQVWRQDPSDKIIPAPKDGVEYTASIRRAIDAARSEHAAIAARHGISGGFGPWFAGELNNARIGSVAAYNSRLQAFLHILERQANDFPAFYAYVERIAGLDRAARERCLDAWERDAATVPAICPGAD